MMRIAFRHRDHQTPARGQQLETAIGELCRIEHMFEHIIAENGARRRRLDLGKALGFEQVGREINAFAFLQVGMDDRDPARH